MEQLLGRESYRLSTGLEGLRQQILISYGPTKFFLIFQCKSNFIIIIFYYISIFGGDFKKKKKVLAALNGLFPSLTHSIIFIRAGINFPFMLKIQSATLSAVFSIILLSS